MQGNEIIDEDNREAKNLWDASDIAYILPKNSYKPAKRARKISLNSDEKWYEREIIDEDNGTAKGLWDACLGYLLLNFQHTL